MDVSALFYAALVLLLYFLPSFVAIARRNRLTAVIVLNLLLGWTVLGWFVALGVAFARPAARAKIAATADDREPADDLSYTRTFLKDALDHGVVDESVYWRLLGELEGRLPAFSLASEEAPQPEPAPDFPTSAPPEAPVQSLAPFPSPTPASEPAAWPAPRPESASVPPAAPVPRRPAAGSPWLTQLANARAVVRSDFAVHGLAYLGVLLTFTGTLGFVLFAYGSVNNQWLRALGPLAVPLALGITSWWLYRRGSVLVSVSLELLGAALVPVLLSAAISTPFQGGTQIALRAAMALALAAIYAAAVIRRPASPLKYLVAPMLWMAVWTGGLQFRDNHYSAAQVALTAAAVLLTVVGVRLRPTHRFAQPTRFAAVVGIGTVYALSILFAVTEGGPPLPIFITGLASQITVELLALDSKQALRLSLLQSLILGVTLGAVAQAWNLAAIGMLATVGYLAILEWQELRRPQLYPLLIALSGLVVGLGLSLGEAWPALVAGGVASVWVHGRRIRPLPTMRFLPSGEAATALMVAAAVVPLGFASGLWRLLPQGRALLILAGLLLGATLAVRRWRPTDPFYAWWLPAAGASIAIASAVVRGTVSDAELAAAATLAAIVLGLAPRWPIVRVWSTILTLAWASILVFDAVKLDPGARPVAWSVAALAVVAIASTRVSPAAAHLALAGYAGSAVALFLSKPGAPRVVTLAAWVTTLAVAVVAQEFGRAPLVIVLRAIRGRMQRLERIALLIPPLALVISVPFLVVEAGGYAGVLNTTHRSWTGIALGLTALGYSAAARSTARRRPLAAVLPTASVLLSGVAIAVAAPDLDPSILTVAGSLAVIAVMGGALRRPFMRWFAWSMSIVLSLLLARKVGVATASLPRVLTATGGVLLVGGLLYDELRAGLRRGGEGLRVAWLVPPVALGALAVPVGLSFSYTDQPSVYGWWTIAASALYLVVAVQLRTGAVSGVSYALGAFGVATLVPWHPLQHPALLVPFAAALVATAVALSLRRPASDPWARWDLPPLVVAHVIGALALARTLDADSVAVTWAGLGALSLVVFTWRRHWAWAAGGAGLVLVGAQAAGPGWFALALGAVSAGAVFSASRTAGAIRLGRQVLSVLAAAAAWAETLVWAQRSSDQQIALTAIASATVALVIAVMVRRRGLSRDWVWSWGALATAGTLTSSILTVSLPMGRPAAFVVGAALSLYALACGLVIKPLTWPWLAWLSVASLTGAWGATLVGAGWSVGQATALSAVLAGIVASVLAVLLRSRRLPPDWLDASAAVTSVTLVAAGVWSVQLQYSIGPDHRLAALGVAAGTALFALATASVAHLLWRPYLPWVAVAATACAWVEVSVGVGWTVDQVVAFTALAAGVIAIAGGAVARRARLPAHWIFSLAALASVGLGGAIVTGATIGNQRHPYTLAVAAGLALYAIGGGFVALPLGRPWLREVAAVVALASGATVLYDLQPTAERSATAAVGAALASLVVSLGIWRRRPTSAWLRPLALYASLVSAGAIALALAAWPNRGPLIITLLVVGAEAMAAGLTLRRPTPLYASPVLVCGAWLLFASDALRGNPNWLTAPIGVAILATVELARWDRRRGNLRGNDMIAGNSLLLLEYTGMAFLVGASLVQTIFVSVWYGLLAVLLGVALVGWAAITRVRRRTEVGAGVILLSLFLMLTVPVVRIIPEFKGIALWGSIAFIGILLLVVATTIEQSRARVMAGVRRLDQLMAGWE